MCVRRLMILAVGSVLLLPPVYGLPPEGDEKSDIRKQVGPGEEAFKTSGRRCGTPVPNELQATMVGGNVRRFREANRELRVANVPLTIRVRFIHITDGQNGAVKKEGRAGQIKVLNEAYRKAGFEFVYNEAEVTTTVQATWFKMTLDGPAEREAKKKLKSDPTRFLNLYTAQPLGGVLGWARFPWQLSGDPEMDGVVLDWRTLPGGSLAPYNAGDTGTHEVGHWLGLYHTFQDACTTQNDRVEDTPSHQVMFGKPTHEEANKLFCKPFNLPLKGADKATIDLVRMNYMNYVDDDAMDRFTEGQIVRMKELTMVYRSELFVSGPNAGAATGELPFKPVESDP